MCEMHSFKQRRIYSPPEDRFVILGNRHDDREEEITKKVSVEL